MTCIIHSEGQGKYDELFPITAKTAEKILLAKSMHENGQEYDHDDQCELVPLDRLVNCFYHKNPCYKKFVWVTVKNRSKSASNLPEEKAPRVPEPSGKVTSLLNFLFHRRNVTQRKSRYGKHDEEAP